MNKIEINLTKKYTMDHDWLVNFLACESCGFDYWAEITTEGLDYEAIKKEIQAENLTDTICYEDVLAKALLDGKTLKIYDVEDGTKYNLTIEKLVKGVQLNFENRPFDNDLNDGDAKTADCILQYAIFEEIVYS